MGSVEQMARDLVAQLEQDLADGEKLGSVRIRQNDKGYRFLQVQVRYASPPGSNEVGERIQEWQL